MRRLAVRGLLSACVSAALLGCVGGDPAPEPAAPAVVRVAVFNIWELSRDKLDELGPDGQGANRQLRGAAEIVQRIRPDVLLLNEIDFDPERENARLFVERYLTVSQGGQPPIDYPHVFFEETNTGVPSGQDLDLDGSTDSPEDGFGFGHYPGQYGMALLSRFPIRTEGARTMRLLRWIDMPGTLIPDGTGGKPEWYPPAAVEIFRLSSKSHWDVPLEIGSRVLRILASHPTPTVFDGEEDRNGRRNHDEIRLWADYLTGGEAGAYIVDDAGERGGLDGDDPFVILGDLNLDPQRAEPIYGRVAIDLLLEHPRVRDPVPTGSGGAADTAERGGNETWTSPYGRIDYVLPSADLAVRGSGVFWPAPGEAGRELVEDRSMSSDHRLVWVDLEWGAVSRGDARSRDPGPAAAGSR